uniref:Kappa-scoloptoxin(03)-Ssm1b n=1 Tax=Scolopendra mutilans TaxID=2836329 RepID=TX31B_SCOMU|nr:RecName: Full=Kappa-scoloptoxin(03)-Ssm1b; Short=Kappa-SLPTX(03)-Ssm1b; AltName: Full=Kappa-scoloptoxin-Ssm1b; Short=Kappa-SLPTX-Ssm1b; Flags: Precursor [Scolopendra mutilans]AFM55016.1 putative K+ channel inhibitor 7 [Scolopendra subspinipes]
MKPSMAILLVIALIIFSLDKSYSANDKPIGKCGDAKRNKPCLACSHRSSIADFYSKCCTYDAVYNGCLDKLRH